jgi:hypothetical protein
VWAIHTISVTVPEFQGWKIPPEQKRVEIRALRVILSALLFRRFIMWIKKSIAEIPTNKHPLEVVEDLITTGSITDISLEIDDIGTENEYVKIMFKNKKRGS